MKKPIDWNELKLFLAVARADGLSGGARSTGVSAPTLGRRMTSLERRLDQQLFERRQTGYELTDAGHALYQQALEMEGAANAIERWREQQASRVVRISAGAWNTRFLARRIGALWKADEAATIELTTAHARVDIARRHADIGIRNRAPTEARLIGRKLFDVAYCVYRGKQSSLPTDKLAWVSVTGDAGVTPWARWTAERHGERSRLSCSDARTVLDFVAAGAAQAVLPCFAGDLEPELVRVGEPIAELRDEQWLVLNESARKEPEVRRVIDRIVKLFEASRGLFTGAGVA